MEVRDGFIVGVDSHCDRWCERCPLTARCRLFIDRSAADFVGNHGTETTRRIRHRRNSRRWWEWVGRDLETGRPGADGGGWEGTTGRPPSLQKDSGLLENAQVRRTTLTLARASGGASMASAIRTIEHFSLFVPTRLRRALTGAATGEARRLSADANGSAKAALLGLEQMQAAWHTLREAGHLSEADTAPFLAEVASIMDRLDRACPHARAFVRPGFDEPEAFMKLEAGEPVVRVRGSA